MVENHRNTLKISEKPTLVYYNKTKRESTTDSRFIRGMCLFRIANPWCSF